MAAPFDVRLAALRRFATAITILNVLGHTVLGFEQAWAHPVFALLAAYGTEWLLEFFEARARHRTPRYHGTWRQRVDFFLPAHITGLAVSMLLYANAAIGPVVFGATASIASKYLLRLRINGQGEPRHIMNPSNAGITVTLLAFPWVGIAPPYQFTESLYGWVDWLLPVVILCSGTFLNGKLTKRLPLIGAWLAAFALQATIRSAVFETPLVAALLPMTGVAFLLFTFYMITDPATTPREPWAQVAFGVSVAAAYGLLLVFHIVFGLFFALSIVCAARGIRLWALNALGERAMPRVPAAVHARSSES
jgi:enediyne biosynthesis protein E5